MARARCQATWKELCSLTYLDNSEPTRPYSFMASASLNVDPLRMHHALLALAVSAIVGCHADERSSTFAPIDAGQDDLSFCDFCPDDADPYVKLKGPPDAADAAETKEAGDAANDAGG
jgi:hypothetical protein